MKKKDKDYFKNYLAERLEELLHQADNTVSGMTETKENLKKSKLPWSGLKMIPTGFVNPVVKIFRLDG
jgi:hypothetical protein